MGKSIAKAGLGLAKQVPGSGAMTPFIDEDAFTSQAGEWASYVARKLGNKDDVQLVNEPLEVLTPLFVQELSHLAEKAKLVLFFDTYERTSPFLDAWLRELLDGRHGELPANVMLVIAGRDELDKNHWADYENFIARFPLNPFTDEEAIQYLHRKGITNDQIIEVILHLSGRLPLLVTTLAATSPNDPAQIGDPSETAVERFLQWIDDPKKRQVAIDASLPRLLNRDIIAVLQGEDTADDLFNWLKSMPFVEQRPDGWAYHDIARTQMLRYKRRTSPQGWSDIHGKLADYYDTQRTNLQLDEKTQWSDATWQTYSLSNLYHSLCKSPQALLPQALNDFLVALNNKRSLARTWAETITQSGIAIKNKDVQLWGEKLDDGIAAYDEGRFEVAVEMFTSLLSQVEITSENRSVALSWRGDNYRLLSLFEEALEDFNQAIRLNPKNDWAIGSRGETFQAMEWYDQALSDFNQALELNPKLIWAIVQQGKTYRLMGRNEEALKEFNQAIKLDPKDKWAFTNRGIIYRLMRSYQKALEDFNQAIKLDQTYAQAFAQRGFLYQLLGFFEESLQNFNQAIELDSNSTWAIVRRGETYQLAGLYEDALQDFRHVVELEPKNVWAISNRGLCYGLLGFYKEAIQDFSKAIELKTERSSSFACRGIAYLALNQTDNANTDIEYAIELARQKYNENPDYCRNTFNLALYYLAKGDIEQAKCFYRDPLNRGVSVDLIREAVRDLTYFLTVFPGHQAAQMFKQGLEKRIKGQEND